MKKIKYKIIGHTDVYNPKTKEIEQIECISAVVRPYSDENLATVQTVAYNGQYTVEDDGVEEITTPSQLDIIEAQVTYTAMMTDTLLED